jgi:hypothetical protein
MDVPDAAPFNGKFADHGTAEDQAPARRAYDLARDSVAVNESDGVRSRCRCLLGQHAKGQGKYTGKESQKAGHRKCSDSPIERLIPDESVQSNIYSREMIER